MQLTPKNPQCAFQVPQEHQNEGTQRHAAARIRSVFAWNVVWVTLRDRHSSSFDFRSGKELLEKTLNSWIQKGHLLQLGKNILTVGRAIVQNCSWSSLLKAIGGYSYWLVRCYQWVNAMLCKASLESICDEPLRLGLGQGNFWILGLRFQGWKEKEREGKRCILLIRQDAVWTDRIPTPLHFFGFTMNQGIIKSGWRCF